MKSLVLAAALSLAFTGGASALTCKEDTAAKKLAGAAATSHMKKCETEQPRSARPTPPPRSSPAPRAPAT